MQPLPQPKHPPIPTGDKDPKTVIRKPTPARRVKKNDGNAPSTRKDEYKYLGYLNLHITDVRDESGTITEFTLLDQFYEDKALQSYLIDFFSERIKEILIIPLQLDNPSLKLEIDFISIKPGSLSVKTKIYSKIKKYGTSFTFSCALMALLNPIISAVQDDYGSAVYEYFKDVGGAIISEDFLEHPKCYTTLRKEEIECASKETDLRPGIYIFSSHGDTLSEMAKRALEVLDFGEISLNQMMMTMYQLNLNRFDGSIHKLQANVALALPTIEEVGNFTREEADRFIQSQSR